jgi:hypothetical protein
MREEPVTAPRPGCRSPNPITPRAAPSFTRSPRPGPGQAQQFPDPDGSEQVQCHSRRIGNQCDCRQRQRHGQHRHADRYASAPDENASNVAMPRLERKLQLIGLHAEFFTAVHM